MTNLKEVNFGINIFCGPSVLSALTGKSTDECAAVISAISGRKEIKAVEIKHILEAVCKLRFNYDKIGIRATRLFGVLSELSSKDGLYLITVPRHIVAIEVKESKIYICDNHTKSPIDAASSARLTQSVEEVYKITARAEPKFIGARIEIELKYNNIYLKAIDEYEDSRDNVSVNRGQIYYRNSEELSKIIQALENIRG